MIDYLNREYVIAHLVECDEKLGSDYHIRNVRCLTDGCQRVEKTVTVTDRDGSESEFQESVRLYSQAEMVDMMSAAGLVHVASYGSLSGQPFEPESKRLIMVAEKRGT